MPVARIAEHFSVTEAPSQLQAFLVPDEASAHPPFRRAEGTGRMPFQSLAAERRERNERPDGTYRQCKPPGGE